MAKIIYLFKTRPGYIAIIIQLIGILFFGFWANFLLSAKLEVNGVNAKTGQVITALCAILFAGFALACIGSVIMFRIFYLTIDELIITQPLLFHKRKILIADIERIEEKDEDINISRGLSYKNLYTGQRATLQLIKGKRIKISSIEIWGYDTLIKKLRTQLRIKNGYNR